MAFPYTEAPTGSLGQGLSIGVGMALNAKYVDYLPYKTFVLLGDSEMSEGSNWEAIQVAAHYKLNNLIGIVDVNRLGQRGETMYGHRLAEYEKRVKAFGWETVLVKDGHDLGEIVNAYQVGTRFIASGNNKPIMIIAKTFKGRGVSFLENKEGTHGKALSKDECERALSELGEVDREVRGNIKKPFQSKKYFLSFRAERSEVEKSHDPQGVRSLGFARDDSGYRLGNLVATREAYGNTLVKLGSAMPNLVVLDAELSDSTRAEKFKHAFPERFFEMYIAEQNMVGVAEGLALRGKIPFISTFAAFFTRAFDQIRMSQYARANIKFTGSHGGVSIGQDGPSQMGLEDIAMFRTIQNSIVYYPCDAVSTEALVREAVERQGVVYIRTTRAQTPVIYDSKEIFFPGGSRVVRRSNRDAVTVIGAGITLHEALAAYEILKKENILIRVIDLYSIKPVDEKTLRKAAEETKALIVVEDHVPEGGIADAVRSVFIDPLVPIYSLAVHKTPKSGTPEELLRYEEIDRNAIVKLVKKIIS